MKQKLIQSKDYFLTLSHYKEPLLLIPETEGYGYYGALLSTPDGALVQCHICGELFSELNSHVRQTHKVNVQDYRDKFKLMRTTALISETMREERKNRTIEWAKSLTPEQKEEYRAKAMNSRKKRRPYQPPETLESKNKKGTCPDQLLSKIKEVTTAMGRTPSLAEFIDATDGQRYKHLIIKTFGSWVNALKMLGLQPKEKERKGYRYYSDEELLEYLSLFAQENRKLPTATDCKRGLLPDYAVFIRRFGSIENARQMAGVYNFVDQV